MSLANEINQLLENAFADCGLPTALARATRAGRPEWGELQCNGALSLAKSLGRQPRDLAMAVARKLRQGAAFDAVDVAGPGFINLKLSARLLARHALDQLADPACGIVQQSSQSVIIDYGGPNVAKPLHVGHLRSLVIGESLRRILHAQGHRTISDVHLGDWGLQMGMLIGQIGRDYPTLSCFADDPEVAAAELSESTLGFGMLDLQRLYPQAAAACRENPARMAEARELTAALQAGHPGCLALWRAIRAISLAVQQQDFAALNVHFDLLLGESDVQPLISTMLADLRERGIAVESEGALIVEVAEDDDAHPMPPLLLTKSDGAALYATTDLATILARTRINRPARIIYVVDQRQALHFEQVFRAARRAGYASEVELIHAGFGTVNGPDGKPYKTREGGVALLADLLAGAVGKARERLDAMAQNEHGDFATPQNVSTQAETEQLASLVGIGAIKFADLSSYRLSGYNFDPERMVSFEGKTGPYVQYACVRVTSILSRAAAQGLAPAPIRVEAAAERALAFECARFPDVVASAAANLAPNEIADYVFNLAQTFSRFYLDCPVLAAEDKATQGSRLSLCALTRNVLGKGMELLGIVVPEKM
ncbi:arginine--tRNA ligase (plasmid) [Cupriavidus necator]|uniref:Arginine--tRNA ligase n=1 Tax=Cupriavidus necator TaxID=106590 RepID=A0A367P8I9_CUPNE|nr:arginine--tRNA ligase [Cupriavidus necator]QQX89532.1 arginine--tRNA ligase [Cupriavidus necator]RCJ03547.1 arginine--tRNA ligase [Cupriavidus necator]